MIDIWDFVNVFRKPPTDPNLKVSMDYLYDEGLTMGVLIIGRQGTGKTSSLAGIIFDHFIRHPGEAIFVLDWSGSITDSLFHLILQEKNYQELLKRVVYDDMGNPEWAMPLPEFSQEYGDIEDQAQRVSTNLSRLAPELVSETPVVGGLALADTAPHFFRLLTAITNEYGESWQITEAKRLIYDIPLLRQAKAAFGHKVPATKVWLENSYMEKSRHDRDMDTKAIIGMLSAIEPNPVRARLGYFTAGWTPKEAIEKGLLVICDGARLINQPSAQHYLFMQVYSLIMQEINKRRPGDPKDLPVTLVLDEVYSLLRIKGMAPEIASLSPQYRTRKLQLFIVLQELEQMSKDLRPHIWSLGNIVSFALANHDEAFEMAQQLFPYDPYMVKVAPTRQGQNPLMESDRGQYLEYADWIQSFHHRQCIIRRYVNEHWREDKIQFVAKTYETPHEPLKISIQEAKDHLIRSRGIMVRAALEVINNRKIEVKKKDKPPAL